MIGCLIEISVYDCEYLNSCHYIGRNISGQTVTWDGYLERLGIPASE